MLSKHSASQRLVTALLCIGMAYVLLVPPLKRGLFFREDYLPFLIQTTVIFGVLWVVAAIRREPLLHGDVDILLMAVVGLYALSVLWAKTKLLAVDGALKYSAYLLVFIMARFVTRWDEADLVIRHLLILSGVAAASVGYLTAARFLDYPSAVQDGALFGSFQYPNALAAYSMFVFFPLLGQWTESANFRSPWWLIDSFAYSVCAFLLVGAIVLSYSRATWILYIVMIPCLVVLAPPHLRIHASLRSLISLISVGLVAARLDAGIRSADFHAVRAALWGGLAYALLLSLALSVAEKALSRSRQRAGGTGGPPQHTNRRFFGTRFPKQALVVLIGLFAAAGVWLYHRYGIGVFQRILPPSVYAGVTSIGFVDRSLVARIFATTDALRIALDNPFGTGAGGWSVLYHRYQVIPYWFTETHNHFAQVLVEAGFPGLIAYVGFWAGIVTLLAKSLRTLSRSNEREEGHAKRLEISSLGIGVIALAAHSIADFDLSLPAIAIGLFAALGSLCSKAKPTTDLAPTTDLSRRPGGFRVSTVLKNQRKSGTGPNSMVPAFRTGLSVLLLAIAVASGAVANRLLNGMARGSYGVQLMQRGEAQNGRALMISAMSLDPHNPDYALALAASYADEFRSTGDLGLRGMAKLYIDLGHSKDPLSPDRQTAEVQLLDRLGLSDECAKAAYELWTMIPVDKRFAELAAKYLTKALSTHIDEMTRLEQDDAGLVDHKAALDQYSKMAEEIERTFHERQSKITGLYRKAFDPASFETTPPIQLVLGQASFLRGDAYGCIEHLSRASKDKSLTPEVSKWLAACSRASGVETSLTGEPRASQAEVMSLTALFGLLR